jgi:hypothetical protein
MKQKLKRWVTMCLALAMVLVSVVPGKVDAATTTKSMTLYVGEEAYVSNLYDVKSASSSKKSVASVAKDKSYSTHANITAKKAGTTTVTVKTKKGTFKYKVTVKKLDITGSFIDLGNGYMLLKIKNNTKQTFTTVYLDYALKDANGEVQLKDSTSISDVVAGKTVYKQVYYTASAFTPDVSQCTMKATGDNRSLSAKYTNASSKVTAVVTPEIDGTDIKYTIKMTNTLKKQSVSGDVYLLVYDENGNLVDETSTSFYLKGGAVDTSVRTCFFYGKDNVSSYTYKTSVVAYYYTY